MTNLTLPTNGKSKQPIYVGKYKVVDIKKPAQKLEFFDIDLIFVLKDDNNFEHNFRFSSKLYKNGNLPVNFSKFLVVLGILDVDSDTRTKIFNEILSDNNSLDTLKSVAINKEVKMLKYVYAKDENGKLRYKFWNGNLTSLNDKFNPFEVNNKDELVIKAFLDKYNSEYPIKDYNPNLLEEETVSETKSDIPF